MKIKTKTIKTKTMKNPFLKFAAAAVFATVLIGCDDDDTPEVINEEELITTVTYELTSTTQPAVTFTSRDQDGDGPLVPTVTVSGNLVANTTYTGSVRFLNELESPAENITEEVEEEADEHEVFYNTSVNGLTINKVDNDPDGNPLGLRTNIQAGAAGTGTLTIVLRHEPKKPNNGSLSDAGGETDVEVVFPVTIQ